MASGTTRWRSNLKPHGSEELQAWAKIQGTKVVSASVNATHIKAGTKVTGALMTGAVVNPTSYVKLGTNQYIFWGAKGVAASIIAAATKLVGGTVAGSLYLCNGAKLGMWFIKSTSVASKLEGY